MIKSTRKSVLNNLAYGVLGLAVLTVAGCSGESEEAPKPVSLNNTMDIKQPAAQDTPKASLQSNPLPVTTFKEVVIAEAVTKEEVKASEVVSEVKEVVAKVVTEKTEAVKASVPVVTQTGKQIFTACIGCHGAKAEGSVGPRLNNQTTAMVIDKLTQYKAGEQRGPMTAVMSPMAASLSDADIKLVAGYVVTLR